MWLDLGKTDLGEGRKSDGSTPYATTTAVARTVYRSRCSHCNRSLACVSVRVRTHYPISLTSILLVVSVCTERTRGEDTLIPNYLF